MGLGTGSTSSLTFLKSKQHCCTNSKKIHSTKQYPPGQNHPNATMQLSSRTYQPTTTNPTQPYPSAPSPLHRFSRLGQEPRSTSTWQLIEEHSNAISTLDRTSSLGVLWVLGRSAVSVGPLFLEGFQGSLRVGPWKRTSFLFEKRWLETLELHHINQYKLGHVEMTFKGYLSKRLHSQR